MNQVNLVGRLGQKPETKNGACKFSIATNDGTKEKPKTNWHNIVAFGKTGEVLQQYLDVGNQIAISGRLDYNKHEEKSYTSIIVNTFTFVGGNKTEDANPF
jgi:single-strand DNA-binding protein